MQILTALAFYEVVSATVQLDAERDLVGACQAIGDSLKHHLDDRYEDHAYVVKVFYNTSLP